METASIVVGVIFFIISFILFAVVLPKALKKQKRKIEIARIGHSATAHITSLTPTGGSVNDNPEVLMGLHVTTIEGTKFSAKVKTVIHVVQLPQFQEGAEVKVKYLEFNGQKEFVVEGTQVSGRYIS